MNKWQKEVQQSLLNSEAEAIKALENQYKQALKNINEKIRIFTANIMELDDSISVSTDPDEQARLLSMKQSKIYQKQYQEALKGQVSGILDKMQSDQYSTIDRYLHDCYETSYVGTFYDLAKQGIPIIQPINQAAVTKAILTDSKIVEGYYNRLGVSTAKLKKVITQEISRGIASGLTYGDIARNINNASRSGAYNAYRIARTEGHRIQQSATYDAQVVIKNKGIDVLRQWDAVLDGRTRDSHRMLDGQIREVDEPFEINGRKVMKPGEFGRPEEDINCRCIVTTRIPEDLDEEELETLRKRAEFFGLDKTKNFEEYREKYLKSSEAPIVQRTSFTPAKTIEEAESYAKKFVDTHYQSKYSGNITYKGMSLENANKMNYVLDEVFSSYDVPMLNNLKTMNFREAKWKTAVEDGIAAAYQWGNGGTMFMNQKIFASEKVTSGFIKKADDLLHTVLNGIDTLLEKSGLRDKQRIYLEALKKTGVQCFAQSSGIDFAEATFVHEAGHMLDDKLFRKLFKENGFNLSESMAKYAGNISGYAVSTNSEYIAESFSAFWYGKTDILDPNLVKIFQGAGTVAKSSVANSATDDIISSVKAFAKGSKDFPTVFLPKQEYAHVMSEIATNLTAERDSKQVFRQAIGEYVYTVENNGFGDYRVIGKELIDSSKYE